MIQGLIAHEPAALWESIVQLKQIFRVSSKHAGQVLGRKVWLIRMGHRGFLLPCYSCKYNNHVRVNVGIKGHIPCLVKNQTGSGKKETLERWGRQEKIVCFALSGANPIHSVCFSYHSDE